MKQHSAKNYLLPFFSLLVPLSIQVSADVLSLNFIRASSGETTLAATDLAGQVPVANWNNTTMLNADSETVGIILNDDSGSATTALATWQSGAASWSVIHTGTGTAGDLAMMTGYLDQDGDGAGQIHTITVADIPYEHYDVYLYHSSNNGMNRTAKYVANTEEIFTRNLAPADTFDGFSRAGYANLSDAANLENLAGNFVKWENLSGSTLSISAEALGLADGGAGDNTRRAPIQGIQIVERATGFAKVALVEDSDVSPQAATLRGDLTSNGTGADEATLTLLWGESDGGYDPNDWQNSLPAGSLTAPGAIEAGLTDLAFETRYFYRFQATNSLGSIITPFTQSFTTLPDPVQPSIENRPATALAITEATLNAELLYQGAGGGPVEITFYWGTTDGGTDPGSWENSTNVGALTAAGPATTTITGLAVFTTHYFRSYATNSVGSTWAPESSDFRTLSRSAPAISLNFIRGSSGETPLDPGDVAGAVPAANWNNTTTTNSDSATDVALINSDGAATTARGSWQTAGATWSVATDGTGDAANKKLMMGYLDQGGDGNGQIHTIQITNIPFPAYNVLLYHSSSGGPDRTARYQANGIDIFTRNLNPANTFDGFINAQYETLADAISFDNPAGNYIVWEGLTGDLSIEAQGLGTDDGGAGGNTRRAPIQGIQIVAASPLSPLQFTDISYNGTEGNVALTFNAIVGLSYIIESSTTLTEPDGEWTEIIDSLQPTSESHTFVHTLPNPSPSKLFYRVRAE